jgi:LysM repeat protein
MKQFLLSLFAVVFSVSFVQAQKGDLVVKSSDKGLYLDHKVAAKESFYSVGRLYNVHPKFIASYNKLDISKGLQIDQKLRIPLTETNFTKKVNTGTPVYFKTNEKTGLAKISKATNDVLLSNLRGWNKLNSDEVKEGTKIIIGFLLSKEMPAIIITPATKIDETPVVVEEKPTVKVEEKPVVKVEAPGEKYQRPRLF